MERPVEEPKKTRKSRKAYRDEIVKKAYDKVSKKLESTDDSKAIDDLVKLLKADKDLGEDEANGGEIDIRWVPGKDDGKDG